MSKGREQFNIVIVGHVDHGKSTVIGRLLADTNSLPLGKLEQVKERCKNDAKPFEYAFLLDALKDEQAQGITIDIARCFFKTAKRDYIILDAPGHIEFLKNMVTGAAHAEAALLVIDAAEGVQENSKRHGYLLSMLGIKQVTVLVNKMDLIDYQEAVFNKIKEKYQSFLKQIKVEAVNFIPISAREGDNLTRASKNLSWYKGPTVLAQIDAFTKAAAETDQPFRLPVQDIYKFTEAGDDRRIAAGTINTGRLKVGDEIIFYPSGKKSQVNSLESFNTPKRSEVLAEEAIGVTFTTQIYIRPGELMVKAGERAPHVSNRFRANVFWMGKAPLIMNKDYRLKIAATRMPVKLIAINNVLDAALLSSNRNKRQVDRNDVAECIFETSKPIAFDLVTELEPTSRFVLVDNYEIAGGGIIVEGLTSENAALKKHIAARELIWEPSAITAQQRAAAYQHRGKFIVITGRRALAKRKLAKALEKELFGKGFKAYYLGISNLALGLETDIIDKDNNPDEHIRRLGELARIMTDAGQIFITTFSNADDHDLEKLKLLNAPQELLVINIGESNFKSFQIDLNIPANYDLETELSRIFSLLKDKEIILDYSI